MNAKTFEDFTTTARSAGFDEVLERRWAPDTVLDVHTHNFDAEAAQILHQFRYACKTPQFTDLDHDRRGRQARTGYCP